MRSRSSKSGFTLIEMIVSLGLFSVVVTISVGALIVLIGANRQLQEEQNVLSNLSFALDSMTREIRTGLHFYCLDAQNPVGNPGRFFGTADLDDLDESDVQDCHNGRQPTNSQLQGVTFYEGGDSITGVLDNRILYYFDSDENDIFRRVGDGPSESITADGIFVTEAEFFVTGSEPLSAGSANDDQAAVTIFIEATASNPADSVFPIKRHRIQTTVVQRTLDI